MTTQHSASYTSPTAEDLERIPAELHARAQWVLWRGADRLDKDTGTIIGLEKIPYTTDRDRKADTTDPQTWATFQRCVDALPVVLEEWEQADPAAYRGGGLGFVFAADDPYCGIDLDHCVDPDTRQVADWAQAHVEALASYTEVTPSGTGLHVLVQGVLPPKGRKKGAVEMYNQGRFFTMTGWHVPNTPPTIEARHEALYEVHGRVFGAQHVTRPDGTLLCYCPTCDYLAALMPSGVCPHCGTAPCAPPMMTTEPPPTLLLDDMALLDKAMRAKTGTAFSSLWAGDWTGHGSQSEADLALCIRLAFWSQDAEQLDRLFRQCGLMRAKWDEQRGDQTYGERTIAEALARQTEHYRTPGDAHRRRNGQAQGDTIPTGDLQDARPVIRIGPDITRMVDEGQAALLALPHGPVIFQRARRLSIIARGVKPPRWLHRPADAPVIVEVQARYLEELATKAARWEKYDKRGKRWEEVTPPARFAETLQGRPSWPFPLLEGIVHSPTLRPDGSVLDTPGYDSDTGLFFDSNGTLFPPVPQRPTLDDARSAIGCLQEVVKDFPFTEQWHFSAWLSAVLSVVCRYTILGPAPMHGITATTRGSGKSLLADTIAIVGTGRPAARWSQVDEEDEERKRLLSLALDGDPLVCIDNVTAPLGSGALAMALTATSIKDRILGKTQTLEAPLSAVFLCTGNNVAYVGDVARRVVPIALDPHMERPEERTRFHHNPLLPWVQRERPRFTVAALTLVKAYFEASCPAQGVTPLGSFEAWSDLIRQALVWAGEADPCEGRKDIEATSNPEFEKLGTLLHAWKACYPDNSVTLKQVIDDIHHYAQHVGLETTRNEWNDLQDALGSCDQKYDGKSLHSDLIGCALRTWHGRIIDGMRLVKTGTYHRAAQWHIECL